MSFDRLAPHYRWLEVILAGCTLHRARTAWLSALADARRILIVGEGHGRGVEAVLSVAPRAGVTVVELSTQMIAVAQRRLAARGIDTANVTWLNADARTVVLPAAEFDAVVTQFFLDCFSPADVTRVVARLAASAQPNAQWLLADFRVPEHGWARWRARAIHAGMYLFFRYATRLDARRLTPPDAALREAGFNLGDRQLFCAGLVHSDRWARGD